MGKQIDTLDPSQGATRRARLVVWAVCVAALSLMPLSVKRAVGTTGVLHNAGHLVAFAITGILFLQWKRPTAFHVWRVWPVLGFAFALEWLEAVLFGNIFEWRDIRTDALGLLAATLVYGICDLLGAGNVPLIRTVGEKDGLDGTSQNVDV